MIAFLSAMLAPVFTLPAAAETYHEQEAVEFPEPGRVNMIVLGDKFCRACRLMKPILAELKQEYGRSAVIRFYEISEHPEFKSRFEIKTTPTILFYDEDGELKERYEGYTKKNKLVDKLQELGAAR
jgi:thioredoxin 1